MYLKTHGKPLSRVLDEAALSRAPGFWDKSCPIVEQGFTGCCLERNISAEAWGFKLSLICGFTIAFDQLTQNHIQLVKQSFVVCLRMIIGRVGTFIGA
jgi:hypothetical protein